MSTTQLAKKRTARAEEVFEWRLDQLVRAGYERQDAGRLARSAEVDLHEAIDLVRAGCPSELAVSILR
jgi:hypothetical protein